MCPVARALALSLLLSAWGAGGAAASPFCDLLWVTRNMLFDREGYCFGSVLGAALFDNAGCTPGGPALSAEPAAAVTRMKELEARSGCRTDTAAAPSAGQRAIHARLLRLQDLPEPDELGWACIGYLGPGVALRSGASAASPAVGRAEPGQSLVFNYLPRGGWHYVIVTGGADSGTYTEGWAEIDIAPGFCREEAG